MKSIERTKSITYNQYTTQRTEGIQALSGKLDCIARQQLRARINLEKPDTEIDFEKLDRGINFEKLDITLDDITNKKCIISNDDRSVRILPEVTLNTGWCARLITKICRLVRYYFCNREAVLKKKAYELQQFCENVTRWIRQDIHKRIEPSSYNQIVATFRVIEKAVSPEAVARINKKAVELTSIRTAIKTAFNKIRKMREQRINEIFIRRIIKKIGEKTTDITFTKNNITFLRDFFHITINEQNGEAYFRWNVRHLENMLKTYREMPGDHSKAIGALDSFSRAVVQHLSTAVSTLWSDDYIPSVRHNETIYIAADFYQQTQQKVSPVVTKALDEHEKSIDEKKGQANI